MEEYGFYLLISATLMVAHQAVAFIILGGSPLKAVVACSAEHGLNENQAAKALVASVICGLFIQPLFWMVLPSWIMVWQLVLLEVVAVRRLLEMRRQQQ